MSRRDPSGGFAAKRRTCRAAAAVALCWLLGGPGSPGGPGAVVADWRQDGSFEFRSDRLDGVHRDLLVDLAPISQAGISVLLSSPSHELEVLGHRLDLRPLEGGATDANLRLELRGQAHLVARIAVAGLPGELEDQVTLPLQVVEVAARVEVDRVPEGYRVKILEAPETAALTVESRLGKQLVTLCRALTLFSGGGQACGGLDLAMSTLRVPLPEPGESRVIEASQLTDFERGQLDGYLSGL